MEQMEKAQSSVGPLLTNAAEQKRSQRKKKSPANFRLNKMLVKAETAEDVLAIVETSIAEFNIVNIGTALYRLALVGGNLSGYERDAIRLDQRFNQLVGEIVETLDADSESPSLQQVVLAPKELSNIIWAATKLGLNDPTLFNAVSRHVIQHIEHFDSINLSLTLWGFAKMDMKAPAMFREARNRVKYLLPEFEPHRICNTVWAFAKTGNTDVDLFRAIADESVRKLPRFNHSNESMLLYSFALGHVHAPTLFRKAMAQQLPAIQSGEIQDPRSLSNLLWAISELELANEFRSLYDAVATSAVANIHRYSLTHMATITNAYAKADIRADNLFILIAQEAGNRAIEDETQWSDVLTLQQSFDHFEMDSGKLKEVASRLNEFQREPNEEIQGETKMKLLMKDLCITSIIAGIVLLLAALVRRYLM